MNSAVKRDFVSMVAPEVSLGIDRSLAYCLGRMEVEMMGHGITTAQREPAIEALIQENKPSRSPDEFGMASA